MLWYRNERMMIHVTSYRSHGMMETEMRLAAKHGWMLQAAANTPGKVAVGATVRNTLLTGGIGLILGGRAHKRDRITVTYVRTPEWQAAHPTA